MEFVILFIIVAVMDKRRDRLKAVWRAQRARHAATIRKEHPDWSPKRVEWAAKWRNRQWWWKETSELFPSYREQFSEGMDRVRLERAQRRTQANRTHGTYRAALRDHDWKRRVYQQQRDTGATNLPFEQWYAEHSGGTTPGSQSENADHHQWAPVPDAGRGVHAGSCTCGFHSGEHASEEEMLAAMAGHHGPTAAAAAAPAAPTATAPASGPAQTPASGPAQTPASGPAQTPASGPAQTPASGPAQTPASGPVTSPAQALGTGPAVANAASPAAVNQAGPATTANATAQAASPDDDGRDAAELPVSDVPVSEARAPAGWPAQPPVADDTDGSPAEADDAQAAADRAALVDNLIETREQARTDRMDADSDAERAAADFHAALDNGQADDAVAASARYQAAVAAREEADGRLSGAVSQLGDLELTADDLDAAGERAVARLEEAVQAGNVSGNGEDREEDLRRDGPREEDLGPSGFPSGQGVDGGTSRPVDHESGCRCGMPACRSGWSDADVDRALAAQTSNGHLASGANGDGGTTVANIDGHLEGGDSRYRAALGVTTQFQEVGAGYTQGAEALEGGLTAVGFDRDERVMAAVRALHEDGEHIAGHTAQLREALLTHEQGAAYHEGMSGSDAHASAFRTDGAAG